MGAFLRQMVDSYTDTTMLWMSFVRRRHTPRYPRNEPRSDGDVVVSDLATTISDLGIASNRVVEEHSKSRVP